MAPSPALVAETSAVAIEAPAIAAPAQRPDRLTSAFSGRRWTAIALVSDSVMLWVAASTAIRLGGRSSATEAAIVATMAVALLGRLALRGMYRTRVSSVSVLDGAREAIVATIATGVLALAASALLSLPAASVGALVRFAALAAGLLIVMRGALTLSRQRAYARGVSARRTLIVGAGLVGSQLEQRMRAKPELGLTPVGFLDADPAPAQNLPVRRGPVLGSPDDLAEVVASTGAEQLIIAFSNAPDSKVLPLIRASEQLGLEVAVVPRLFENVNERARVEHVGGLPLVGLRRVDPKSWQFALKHVIDRSAAIALFAACAPLLGVLALAVKLSSPGPVFFRQRRVGRDGQHFDILKFRSMRLEPASVSAGFKQALSASGSAPGGVEGDDRRTLVGTFLRRSSLDELPQLINVLRGQMSLVGPRPERPEFVAMFGESVRRYGDRHRVKSGMTGWAQVHGLRGQTSLAERVEWDNWYIQNWSLWLDLKIMLMTPLALVRAPGDDSRLDGGASAATTVPASEPAVEAGAPADLPVAA